VIDCERGARGGEEREITEENRHFEERVVEY